VCVYKNYAQALSLAASLPRDPFVLTLLAKCLHGQGQLPEALSLFEDASWS